MDIMHQSNPSVPFPVSRSSILTIKLFSSLYVCMAIKYIIVCLWKHHVNLLLQSFPKQECFRSSFSTKFASIDMNTFENNKLTIYVTITINKFLTNSSPPRYFELLDVTSGRGFPLSSITHRNLCGGESRLRISPANAGYQVLCVIL